MPLTNAKFRDLVGRGVTTVTLESPFDPDAFFRTRDGLYVHDEFRRLVVAKAKPSEKGVTHKVANFELMRDLTDVEIEGALGPQHLFDETVACAAIAEVITKQLNGEEGALLNNGYANLFYLLCCVVDVDWSAADRKWHVYTWERGDFRWHAGRQAFSPAT